jgi:hypothetical protein
VAHWPEPRQWIRSAHRNALHTLPPTKQQPSLHPAAHKLQRGHYPNPHLGTPDCQQRRRSDTYRAIASTVPRRHRPAVSHRVYCKRDERARLAHWPFVIALRGRGATRMGYTIMNNWSLAQEPGSPFFLGAIRAMHIGVLQTAASAMRRTRTYPVLFLFSRYHCFIPLCCISRR